MAPDANARHRAPDAIPDRIAVISRHQDHYKLVNALLRGGNDAGLRDLGYTDAQIAKLKEPDARGRIGYALSISNNKEKLRRLRRRLKGKP